MSPEIREALDIYALHICLPIGVICTLACVVTFLAMRRSRR